MVRSTWLIAMVLVGCGRGVNDEDAAELAYVGLDTAIERSMTLGFDGFNAADSANIADQTQDGDRSGTLTVGGQVDQGASDNKGMRLDLTLVEYSDRVLIAENDEDDPDDDEELEVVYDTNPDEEPTLDLQLRDLPDGTMTGTLTGSFELSGDLEGEVTLDLDIAADLEADPDGEEGDVRRVAGTIRVTGTASSGWGTYDVDVTR